MTDPILVDANPLLSALLGGRARDVLFSRQFLFHSPQHTLFEVGKYIYQPSPKRRGRLNWRCTVNCNCYLSRRFNREYTNCSLKKRRG